MINSMTGYANGSFKLDSSVSLSVEIRALNNRYLDLNIRLDDDLKYLEAKIKSMLSDTIKRGKVECRISKSLNQHSKLSYSDDQIKDALKIMKRVALLSRQEFSATPHEIINFINSNQKPKNININEKAFLAALSNVLKNFNKDRAREGKNLSSILKQNVNAINAHVKNVRKFYKDDAKNHQQKLIKKLSDINSEIDQQRLQQEVVYFLQKSDIEEELSRILSHNKEIIDLLKSNDPVGKKLDFMMQELNREANTLGSKSISTRISSLAVDIKVLIEQMREQIQNIE
ncbi:protein YicC [beta proteobacterium KB13]|uniref:Protein YicC n=1 Tax=beta proteobacterium KB13 TaxID=314607 RepID=B6BVL9_9PROT|nr:protein YicC [beta proteobacterium KB13]